MDTDSHSPARTRIRIRIKGPDFRLADQAAADVAHSVTATGVRALGPLPLPSTVEALRSSSSYDELRCHHRLLEIIESKPQTIDALRRINLPAGIEIAVVAPEDPVAAVESVPGEAPAKRNRRRDKTLRRRRMNASRGALLIRVGCKHLLGRGGLRLRHACERRF